MFEQLTSNSPEMGLASDFLLSHPHSGESFGQRERFREVCQQEKLAAAFLGKATIPEYIAGLTAVYQEALKKSPAETAEWMERIQQRAGVMALALLKGDRIIGAHWMFPVDDANVYPDSQRRFIRQHLRWYSQVVHSPQLAVLPEFQGRRLGVGLHLLLGDQLKKSALSKGVLVTSRIDPSNPASEGSAWLAGYRATGMWDGIDHRYWSKTIYPDLTPP